MLLSPLKTKLSCCPLVLLPSELLELGLLPEGDERRSIHGTAICLPPLEDKLLPELLERPGELAPVPDDEPLGLVAAPELLEPGLRPLDELDPEDEPLGLVPAPELLELSDRIAKSIRPAVGLMIVSLMVPSVSPEAPVTLAPIN